MSDTTPQHKPQNGLRSVVITALWFCNAATFGWAGSLGGLHVSLAGITASIAGGVNLMVLGALATLGLRKYKHMSLAKRYCYVSLCCAYVGFTCASMYVSTY